MTVVDRYSRSYDDMVPNPLGGEWIRFEDYERLRKTVEETADLIAKERFGGAGQVRCGCGEYVVAAEDSIKRHTLVCPAGPYAKIAVEPIVSHTTGDTGSPE